VAGGSVVRLGGGLFSQSTFTFGDLNYYNAQRATGYLGFKTYDSLGVGRLADSSVTHPDVVDCRKLWNGYRYWAVYTPLPEVRPDANENPHIMASNDLQHWYEPAGISNPIEHEPVTSYNSDPDLFFDNNTMYCLFRTWTNLPGPGNRGIIKVRYSTDGHTWSSSAEMINLAANLNRIVSPAVIKIGSYYYLYALNQLAPTTPILERWRSTSMLSGWVAYDTCTVNFTNCFLPDQAGAASVNFRMWHFNIDKIGTKYILSTYTRVDSYVQLLNAQNIWLASGTDGKTFVAAKYPLFLKDYDTQVNNNTGNIAWDMGLYRSALLTVNDTLNIFYPGWKGEFEDYPDYIGRTTIKTFDPEITIGKPYNTISASRHAQLAEASALQNHYTFADSLTRADNTTINPSSCGKNWTIRAGTFKIEGNLLGRDATTNGTLELNPDSLNYECIINNSFNQTNFTTDGSEWRIYMKATAYNGYEVDICNGLHNTLAMRCVSSATAVIGRKARNYVNLTDLNTLKFRVVGNNFKVWVNGVLYFNHTLTVAECNNSSTIYNNILASKRICFAYLTTTKTLKIKNITIRNLNSAGL
jgi:hypothetical protein